MSKSRPALEKKAATHPAVTRMTRSSASQARLTSPGQQQDSRPGQYQAKLTSPGQQQDSRPGQYQAKLTSPGQQQDSGPGQYQAKLTSPGQQQDSGPGQYGKQRRKHTDSALAQDLSHMSVSGQHVSSQWDSTQNGQPATPSSVNHQARPRVKSSCSRGGLASVARLVKLGRCKNIVVVAGAGISTASGIPDFRTPGTGLYANLERYNLPYPEAVFNIDYFSDHPQAFFSLAKELYPGSHRPNYIHYFIRMLHHKGLLLRVFTQNIDGLERMCGIPDDKLVEAHGNFATASCHLCYTPYPADNAKVAIMSGNVPTCSFCSGAVKPDVVFFGEDLPQKYFLHSKDFPKADLLIIMGTSLQIEPFASLVNTVRSSVPRLLLNRHAVGPFEKTPLRRADHVELGDLVDSVQRFAQILGWSAEIEHLMSSQGNWCVSPSVPEARRHASCSSEENDSETDGKSSASSSN